MTSDFGLRDGYVGAMRGVVLQRCPEACLVDISHEIPAQDVAHAATVLRDTVPYFPKGSVHLAVVDPGVGTPRRAIVARAAGHLFVGPDNGLLLAALGSLGGEAEVWEIGSRFVPRSCSATFHGRDIFAPMAGRLAAGMAPQEVGRCVGSLVPSPLTQARTIASGILGRVSVVDHFGNLKTDVHASMLAADAAVKISFPGRDLTAIEGLSKTYGDAKVGAVMVLTGSSGYIEIAVNQGAASEVLALAPGDAVKIDVI